jgi:UDP-N-acetylglucosamine 2-epimerase (non-hydrolysing)
MKCVTVVGTRPELIRLCLVFRSVREAGIDHTLVHTGQNSDPMLSDVFLTELGIAQPDVHLRRNGRQPRAAIGELIAGAEEVIAEKRPDALLILGDTDSGLSAIAAARLGVPSFHMEAGNRCFDWRVPEERNRKVIDHSSDWLLPYTPGARRNLLAEGIPEERIFLSGNPITDVLDEFRASWETSDALARLELRPGEYILATAHRQESVDVPERLRVICDGLGLAAEALGLPVILSMHPRTRDQLERAGLELRPEVRVHPPFGFVDFVRLESAARCVITDSGTVQEECSLLGVPTVTCRDSTERPETVECGSNMLSGVSESRMLAECAIEMLAREPNWVSPYSGPEHRGVADRVVAHMLSIAG